MFLFSAYKTKAKTQRDYSIKWEKHRTIFMCAWLLTACFEDVTKLAVL